MTVLPNKGRLNSLNHMPLLSWDGKKTTIRDFEDTADEYAKAFRREVGGCAPDDLDKITNWSAEDLFCTSKGDSAAPAA